MTTIPSAYTGLLSPDQTLIAVGNGTVSIAPVATGIPRYLCVGYAAGWSPDSLSVGVSRNAGTPQQPTREFYIVDVATGAETKLDIDPAQLPGYSPQNAWENGLLISSVAGQQYQNGLPVPTEANADPIQCRDSDAHGDSWMYAIVGPWTAVIQSTDWPEIRIEGGITQTLINRIDAQPWVSANYANMMFMRNPNGQTYQGPVGQGRGLVFKAQGQIYVVTTYYEGTAQNPIPVWNIYRLNDWTATSPCVTLRGVWYVGMFVAVDGDTVTCFGSNSDNGALTYEPVNLATATWQPYVPPVVEPPTPDPIPESVIPPQRPAWILDTEAILTPRGNGISTSDGPGPRYFEDALWVTPAMEPTLESIYFGPEPPRGGVSYEMAYDTALAMALRNGCPVCVNDEWGEAPTQKWIGKFLTAGAQAAWMVEAYRSAGEPLDQYRTRLRARLQLAGSVYAIIPPYYQQQGGGSEASSIETLNVCREELARKSTPPIVIDGFGLRRLPRSAAREADLAAWIAACPQPPSLRVPQTAPTVTGISPAPIYKAGCYTKATLHGGDLAAVDAVLISNGEFAIVRTAATTIEGFVTFRGSGLMQLVAYAHGQAAPSFFFTVA